MSQETDAPAEGESGDYPVVYAQQVMVGASFFDFSLVFFQESFRGNLPVANITLPPATAKNLARVLGEYVANYEKQFQEIRLPPEGEGQGG